MKYVLTSGQMAACDAMTIEQFGVPSMVLMERAALACVSEIKKMCPQVEENGNKARRPVLVVCGNGNNGGDGVAIARILTEQGFEVTLCMAGLSEQDEPKKVLSADCWKQLSIARAYQVAEISREEAIRQLATNHYALVVDALFGVGLSRALTGGYPQLVEAINAGTAKVLAVDMPSGVSADHGQICGCAVRADVTVTFAFYKRGQLFYPGREYCGSIRLADIGITEHALETLLHESAHAGSQPKEESVAICYGQEDLNRLPARRPDSNKGTYGKVLLAAGSSQIGGAAYLCTMAAYRLGAGLVQLVTEESNRAALQQLLPEALFAFYQETKDGEQEAQLLKEKLGWASVAGIGPGLGQSASARALLLTALESELPLVLDADALNLLAEMGDWNKSKAPRIITPHMGEMSRLCGVPIEELKKAPEHYAGQYAQAHHCICVLKDACTVVCDDKHQCFMNTSGNSGMSAGGSGDVLTGLICSLLAQGMEAFEAASLGVYLHGCLGDVAAMEFGQRPMMARDLFYGIEEFIND